MRSGKESEGVDPVVCIFSDLLLSAKLLLLTMTLEHHLASSSATSARSANHSLGWTLSVEAFVGIYSVLLDGLLHPWAHQHISFVHVADDGSGIPHVEYVLAVS